MSELERVLPGSAPDGAYKVAGTAVHSVRWLHVSGMCGSINLGLVRSIVYETDTFTGTISSCTLMMAYTDHRGASEQHRITDPQVAQAVFDLEARETVWLPSSVASLA